MIVSLSFSISGCRRPCLLALAFAHMCAWHMYILSIHTPVHMRRIRYTRLSLLLAHHPRTHHRNTYSPAVHMYTIPPSSSSSQTIIHSS